MKRLAVLFVLVGVSLAAAATLKMKVFNSVNWDLCSNCSDPDGVATLHYVEGQGATKIHVTITGFAPTTSYGVYIGEGLVDSGVANGIRTNDGGNGEVNLVNSGPIAGPVTVKIYLDDPNSPDDPNDPSDGPGYYDPGEEVATGIAQ